MLRITLAAGLAAALVGSAHGEAWKNWTQCQQANLALTEEQEQDVAMSFSFQRKLAGNENNYKDELKEAHQIISIDTKTAKLVVNHNATVWDKLQSVNSEVNVLVFYGLHSSGSSTMASILTCAMSSENDNSTTLFPAQREKKCHEKGCHINEPHTVGVWASDPFTYKGPDGQGDEKTYMIVDLQGLGQPRQLLPDVSSTLFRDATIKMVAMLTEVASEFIYISRSRVDELSKSEYNNMGLAFTSTRENLVRAGDEFVTDAEAKLNIRSVNDPGMIFVTREGEGRTIVDPDGAKNELALDEPSWDSISFDKYQSLTGEAPEWKKLLSANFKHHNVTVNEATKETAWYYNPVPDMDVKIVGDDQFYWEANSVPYPLQPGAACRQYKQMSSDDWKCKLSGGDNKLTPAPPPTYKVMVDHLAKLVYEHAPVRQVAWGAANATAQNLTGRRLKGYLEAGVEEINKAGKVPDNALWRLIAEDRCLVDLNRQIENYYTTAFDLMNEAANQVRFDNTMPEQQIAAQNASFVASWTTAADEFPVLIDNFFERNHLLVSVRGDCTVEAESIFQKLDLRAKRLFKEMAFLGERSVTNRLKNEKKALLREIAAKNKEISRLWWQANMPYFIGLGLIGLALLYIFCRMYSQVCGTCRACGACCEDLQTREHTSKVEYIVQEQGRQSRSVKGLNMDVPLAQAMTPDQAQLERLQELEAIVIELGKKFPQETKEATANVKMPTEGKPASSSQAPVSWTADPANLPA